jgi:hypothetical protein
LNVCEVIQNYNFPGVKETIKILYASWYKLREMDASFTGRIRPHLSFPNLRNWHRCHLIGGFTLKMSGMFYFGFYRSGIHTVARIRPSVPPCFSRTARCIKNCEYKKCSSWEDSSGKITDVSSKIRNRDAQKAYTVECIKKKVNTKNVLERQPRKNCCFFISKVKQKGVRETLACTSDI